MTATNRSALLVSLLALLAPFLRSAAAHPEEVRLQAREAARLSLILSSASDLPRAREAAAIVAASAREMARSGAPHASGLLRGAGLLLARHGDREESARLFEEAAAAATHWFDREAASIELAGIVARGDGERARRLLEASIASMDDAGFDGLLLDRALLDLARVHRLEQRWGDAVAARDRVIAGIDTTNSENARLADQLLRYNAEDLEAGRMPEEAAAARLRGAELVFAAEGVGVPYLARLMEPVERERGSRGERRSAEAMREIARRPEVRATPWALVPGSQAVMAFDQARMRAESDELLDELVIAALAREQEIDRLGGEEPLLASAMRNVLFMAAVRSLSLPADRSVLSDAAADAFVRRYATESPDDVSQRRSVETAREQRAAARR